MLKNCSVKPTAPSFTDSRAAGPPSRMSESSVEPPPMSMLSSDFSKPAHACDAASPISRPSSIGESTSTETPHLRCISLMNCSALLASRTEAVATAMIFSAPRASAMERKRLTHSTARSIAPADNRPCCSVSWPSRTMSFSRASTAKESLAAASTTMSLIEFEPISMAAIFMQV